jgi:hypothetical protein
MKRGRKILLSLAIAAAAVAGTSTTALTQGTATACSASFHVLHDDRIGSLQLPAGAYQISTVGITCLRASHLLAAFLNDWNGVLPNQWRFSVNAVGDGTFTRGTGGVSFRALRTGDAVPNTPGHPSDGGGSHGDLVCPGTFAVQHDDRIGRLQIPRGEYTLTRLGPQIGCARVAQLMARFLERPGGRLGGGWVLLPAQAEFVRFSTRYGFRIDAFAG